MDEQFAAIYLDFENLSISADQTYPSKEKPFKLSPIVDFASNGRNICVKKAYSDWSKPQLARYQNELNEFGFEMIHLPGTSSQGKNGSDLRMTIDILEDIQSFPIINTIVIGSGDTDFIPLIRKVLARGKKVIIVGFDNSVGNLVKNNCTEFKSINELFENSGEPDEIYDPEDPEEQKTALTLERINGRELLIRFIKNRSNDESILLAQLKLNLLRLQPSFSEKRMGFSTFKKFLESLQNDVVEKIENDSESGHPRVYFRDIENVHPLNMDKDDEITKFVYQNLKYIKEKQIRKELAKHLIKLFKESSIVTMHDMVEYLSENVKSIPKISIRKYIFAIAQGRVFSYADREYVGSLSSRPQKLNETINNVEIIDTIYKKRIQEIILDRFSDVNDEIIKKILQ